MLTVTEPAGALLAGILEEQGLPRDVAVRFVFEEEGIALQQDSEQPSDTTFQHDGRTILLLDEQVSELLTDATLDVKDAELVLLHPKEGE